MKRKLLVAAIVALILSFGTLFYEVDNEFVNDGVEMLEVSNGFPFSGIVDKIPEGEVNTGGTEVNIAGIIGNFISWFTFVFVSLFLLDWLAGFIGKLAIRLIIGLAGIAYSAFLVFG